MDRIITTLPLILKAAGDSAEVAEAACMAAWKYAAGDGLREHTLPLGLNEKTLVIAVADSTWQRQLRSFSSQLLTRLNSILGQPLVTALEFRVDPESLAKTRERNYAPPAPKQPIETEAIPLELVKAAAGIQDNQLRRAFLGAAISCIKRVERCQ